MNVCTRLLLAPQLSRVPPGQPGTSPLCARRKECGAAARPHTPEGYDLGNPGRLKALAVSQLKMSLLGLVMVLSTWKPEGVALRATKHWDPPTVALPGFRGTCR